MKRFLFLIPFFLFAATPTQELTNLYSLHCQNPSDIFELVPVLRRYAIQCDSVTEIGVRNMVSTWGLLHGLAENDTPHRKYVGIDIGRAEDYIFNKAVQLSKDNGIEFQFIQENDMNIDIEPTDLLFIDTLHIYAQLTYELEKFCSKAKRYIIMHDTSQTFEYRDCESYQGDYSEYPSFISRTKRGLWPAVVDFLDRHPEWVLQERLDFCNGMTVLRRADLNDFLIDHYPDVYRQVNLLPFDPHGWYGHHDHFSQLITSNTKIAVEIGTWLGLSTRDIANMLPPDGKIYAVDTWLGSIEHQEGAPCYHPILPNLYRQFLSNVIHAKLEDKIVPVRMRSVHAASVFATLNIRPDLIYIDGSHDYVSVMKDLEAWYPLLNKEGIICGDDYGYPDIYKAVNDFAQKHNLRVVTQTLWQLVK